MKQALTRTERHITGMHGGISGDLTDIHGDLTGIRGDLTDLSGNVDLCEITPEDRELGIDINELVPKETV